MARKKFSREKRIYCGKEWLEVDITPVTNMPEVGVEKKEKSSKKQKNLNDKNSKRKFVQTANANFTEEDLHISATYDDRHLPKTLEEAERNVHNYLDRVKRRMKKVTEKDLKYMLVTEYTKEDQDEDNEDSTDKTTKAVRIHHHIIVNGGLSRDDLEIMWTHDRINWKKLDNDTKYRKKIELLGYVNCDRLQPNENGVEGLVKYIDKRKKGCKKWSTSQNLVKPVVKKNDHKYSFKKLREYAKYPEDKEIWRKRYEGYEPTKIEFVYNDYTGWSIYIRLRRLEDKIDCRIA